MSRYNFSKCVGSMSASIALAAAAILLASMQAKAEDGDRESRDARIRRGLEVAPVPLDMRGKDRELVGLGSYLVNVTADCNGCHSAGPATEYARGGNPYFGQPTVVNQATYLGGGRDFGSLIPGTPNIVSRNLTPDKTGRPAGGLSFAEFHHLLRTGEDLDHLHRRCSTLVTQNCLPAPFDGDLLQIMPWPVYRNMATSDIRAIYEYLRAVPCVEGPAAPSVLHNDCT